MSLRLYQPARPLADFVESVWYSAGEAPPHRLERVLPDGTMQLIVDLSGEPLRVSDRDGTPRLVRGPLVCGPRARYSLVNTARQGALIGVHFRPAGAAPLLGVPAGTLRDTDVALEALWGAAAAALEERVVMAPTADARLWCLETALLDRVARSRPPHPAVAHALLTLAGSTRAIAIAGLAADAGFSHRRFIDFFRDAVGLTPKTYCRVSRFQAAVRATTRGEPVGWAHLAAQTGYYDQAHLAHDFRAFAGCAPSEYAARRGDHHNHVALDA